MVIKMKTEICDKLDTYPLTAAQHFRTIRNLIFAVAKENALGEVEESLKWNKPSYRTKGGSTVRIDWKNKEPEHIKVYFHCQSVLVETFREIYPDEFIYEGKRAIVIALTGNMNTAALAHCLTLALKYHSIKTLPLLGA
tara:strand:+ start:344 stop:760 length:417 start_codon:yes stop_codon:yes gene_type:complete